jgi:hypothetical protein
VTTAPATTAPPTTTATTIPASTVATTTSGNYTYFARDWQGRWSTVFGHDPEGGDNPADLVLELEFPEPVDEAPGTARVDVWKCAGRIAYQRVEDTTYVFQIDWEPGECRLAAGTPDTISLTPVDPKTVNFFWIQGRDNGRGGGVMTRQS